MEPGPADPDMLLHRLLEESARRSPDKIAVVCGAARASYAQLNGAADRLGAALQACGLQKGDFVAILHENSFEFIAAYFGALKAGAVAVPLNTDLKPEGLEPILLELKPHAIIASDRQTEKIWCGKDEALTRTAVILSDNARIPRLRGVEYVSLLRTLADGRHVLDISDAAAENDPACIIYTSGSTGRPKGVVLSHKNIVANTRSIISCLDLTERDVQMAVLPFFYVFGLSLLHTHLAVGGTLVLNNQFSFTGAVLEQMMAENVTGFSGVPSTYAYLLHRSGLAALRERLPMLRYCSQAGGHMARQLKLDLRAALPDHTRIIIMYGATEASARLTWLDPRDFLRKIDSIGKEIPGVQITILDENGNEAAPGETGELVAAGPNIMRGYFNDPASTALALDAHGYHTGDLGYRDEEGFLFLTGRRDNQMKVGGRRVDPQEIEDVIIESGLAIEAAVIALPDELLGSAPAALVVPSAAGVSAEELFVFCARRLPRYKAPQLFLNGTALPKNGSGKIDRGKCAEIIMRLQAQRKMAPGA
ncbi:MAG: class I adenylate-forming enzyme family protein [Chitinivibrionales bacterium]|nr:class I adenylate-forming enzyme family protein [Chitinivibrionales bacterium]